MTIFGMFECLLTCPVAVKIDASHIICSMAFISDLLAIKYMIMGNYYIRPCLCSFPLRIELWMMACLLKWLVTNIFSIVFLIRFAGSQIRVSKMRK